MTTRITISFDHPAKAEAFELAFPAVLHTACAMSGLQSYESARAWPKEDGSPTPAYRTLDLRFLDYEAACGAFADENAGAFFGTITNVGAAFSILFSEVD